MAAGGTTTVTINAAAGDYEYYCSVPGHKEAGMVGTLHVVEGAAPTAGGDTQSQEQSPAGESEGGAPAGQAQAVEVDMVDIAFNPKEITIPANTDVVVTLVNSGAAPHTFDVEALAIHSGEYAAGQTGSVTINAAPGDYEYICAVPGHKEAGMVGILHVVEGAAPPAGEEEAPPPAEGGEGGEAGPPQEQTQAPEVDMLDIRFDPPTITIPANTDVVVNLVNSGAAPHNFNVDALGVHSGDYAAGQTGSVTINAPPGEYEYICAVPGHKEAGMVGKLIVQ